MARPRTAIAKNTMNMERACTGHILFNVLCQITSLGCGYFQYLCQNVENENKFFRISLIHLRAIYSRSLSLSLLNT